MTKLTVDSAKGYVEATVEFLPSEVCFDLNQAALVCGHCGAGMKLVDAVPETTSPSA